MGNYVYVTVSLDGYIATSDGGLDWLYEIPNPDNSDYGFHDFLQSIDAVIMGRNTFEKLLSLKRWHYQVPVYILSNTINVVPEYLKDKAHIVNGNLQQLIESLNDEGYRNIYIDGGETIQSFLEEDLIDEMKITTIPVILGDGYTLFGSIMKKRNFLLTKTEKVSEQLVKNHYVRMR